MAKEPTDEVREQLLKAGCVLDAMMDVLDDLCVEPELAAVVAAELTALILFRIKGNEEAAAELGAGRWFGMVENHLRLIAENARKAGGEVVH